MPYPVENLIEGRGAPITVHPGDSAEAALGLMIEHDFSQLPVVDKDGYQKGMVTHGSILCALSSFDLKLGDLCVSDATVKAHAHRPEDDLFGLLDRLEEANAVLIVDGENRLLGIVTSYDSTEYFRRRAEDLMWVEDIERAVKALILVPFTDENDEVDEEALRSAIEDITSSIMISRRDLLKGYKKALQSYFQNRSGETQLDPQCVEDSFSLLAPKPKPKQFDRLVLSECTELLLHKSRWPVYEPFFNQGTRALRTLLDGVRNTRNRLAHFRGELSPLERAQLKHGAEWLEQHSDEHLVEFLVGIPVNWPSPRGRSEPATLREPRAKYEGVSEEELTVVPTEEELSPSDSRYAPLAIWLQRLPSKEGRVRVTFELVEEIIGGPLPPSARMHRSWWANDSVGHVQSKQWLDVGWRVAQVSTLERHVTFAHIRKREKAYIEFFSALQMDLRQETPFPMKEVSPSGKSYLPVASMREGGPQWLHFIFAFAHRSRFRVELYINTSSQDKSKGIFDHLHKYREKIEGELDATLAWERLDDKQASRIAWYHVGSITDDKERLSALRPWAVDAMVRFHEALVEPANGALDALRGDEG